MHSSTHGGPAADGAALGNDPGYTIIPSGVGAHAMSVFVWVMTGVAFWHFSVLVPDRFYGGVIGALVAAVAGALVSGFLLPSPGIPAHNPPGLSAAVWPIPGSIVVLVGAYLYGARRERLQARRR